MTDHKTGTREEWLAARLELLEAEKELTRRSDELARRRQQLPWVRIDKEYGFDTDEGNGRCVICLPGARSFSSTTSCSARHGPQDAPPARHAESFDGSSSTCNQRDVTWWCVSRGPLAQLNAYKQRMGWTVPLGVLPEERLQRRFRRVAAARGLTRTRWCSISIRHGAGTTTRSMRVSAPSLWKMASSITRTRAICAASRSPRASISSSTAFPVAATKTSYRPRWIQRRDEYGAGSVTAAPKRLERVAIIEGR